MNYVLDSIITAKATGLPDDGWNLDHSNPETIQRVIAMTDVDKIGLMGHSLGGATAVAIGREREDIDAVVDLDGTMMGEEVDYVDGRYQYIEEAYPVPVLAIDSEFHYTEGRKYSVLYVNNYVLDHAVCSYHTYFVGSGHMNFTDLPLFAPALAANLGMGSIDPRECIETMNAIVFDFMNYYLKGEGSLSIKEYYPNES